MKKWLIRYYVNEGAYKTGCVGFSEQLVGDRTYVVNWALNRIKSGTFKFYDLTEL